MKLSTVSELLKSPPAEPAIGRRLWKPTSQVVFPSPFRAYSGRKGREEIHIIRGEKCIVRPYKVPNDPKSAVQVARRAAMGEAKGNWHRVSAEARAAWKSFALAQVFPERSAAGWGVKLAGFNAYVRAQVYRQGMGSGLSLEAPRFDVPEAVTGIEEVAPPDGEAFAFRLDHEMAVAEGWSVLFEITPAMPTMKRQPRKKELRWAGETDAESFLPLGPAGSVYLLPRAHFVVEAGRRYGVRARIVSSDGLPGKELMVALIRLAPDADAWTTEAPETTASAQAQVQVQVQAQGSLESSLQAEGVERPEGAKVSECGTSYGRAPESRGGARAAPAL